MCFVKKQAKLLKHAVYSHMKQTRYQIVIN